MPGTAKVADIMTSDVFRVGIHDSLKRADELMKEEKIKHVPVVDGDKYVGLITERTLMEYTLRKLYEFDDAFEDESQNEILDFQQIIQKQDHVIYPEDSAAKAVKLMAKYKVDCLPVVDWEKNLIGLVTSSDILLFINKLFEDGRI